MVSGCTKFHKGKLVLIISFSLSAQTFNTQAVVSGDYCAAIAAKYGISVSDFYNWNPGVGNNCQSLWLNTYYCVGRG
jgi:LysM domain.